MDDSFDSVSSVDIVILKKEYYCCKSIINCGAMSISDSSGSENIHSDASYPYLKGGLRKEEYNEIKVKPEKVSH